MYKLKQKPEDFIVDEILDMDLSGGRFSCYVLQKKGISTLHALSVVSRAVHVPVSRINVAGLKDKDAITSQKITILKGPRKDLDFRDFTLKYLGDSPSRINLGSNAGNRFRIIVRNLDKLPKKIKTAPNLFGEQRFGVLGDNHLIGRLLVKKEFKKAAEILAEREDKLKKHLLDHPSDYIGALRSLGKKHVQFYISAYRSHIWNLAVSHYIDIGGTKKTFPLVGFDTSLQGRRKEILDSILKKENITLRSFIIPEFPELTSDEHERDIYMPVNDLMICVPDDDDLNPGMKKVLIQFWLPAGSYATVAVEYMFK